MDARPVIQRVFSAFFLIGVIIFAPSFARESHFTSIQLTNENGISQVFEIKRMMHVKPESCPSCSDSVSESRSHGTRSTNYDSASTSAKFQSPVLVPSMTVVLGGFSPICDRVKDYDDIPVGLCLDAERIDELCPFDGVNRVVSEELLTNYAEIITQKDMVPLGTGDMYLDRKIAFGAVLLNFGFHDEAITHFTKLLQDHPKTIAALHGRASALARKGLQKDNNAEMALADYSLAIEWDSTISLSYERRAEIYIPIGRREDALADLNKAVQVNPSWRAYFLRGNVNFILERLLDSERDFKKAIELDPEMKATSLYHLGLAMLFRGKIRNSIEVFKEVMDLDKNLLEAHTSLGHAYKELGNKRLAIRSFNTSLSMKAENILVWQLQGSMQYYSGDTLKCLDSFQQCLSLDPYNQVCQYMQGLAQATMGQFYESIKGHTKVIVYKPQVTMKMTAEYVKAHYLREYSRYLHSHLDSPLQMMQLDTDLEDEFKEHWVKLLPFDLLASDGYREQPGLQPSIPDVFTPYDIVLDSDTQSLVCHAYKMGKMLQAQADGLLPNSRLNFAMGLASIHIAQVMDEIWKTGSSPDLNNGKRVSWRDVFYLAVQYRRLVDPEEPVLWMDQMSSTFQKDYTTEYNIIRGEVLNVKYMQYFELVFKLVKTMVDVYEGDDMENFRQLKTELMEVSTSDELISLTRKRSITEQGFLINTQVPSARDKDERLEGVVLALTGDLSGRLILSVNNIASRSKTTSYEAELDHLFIELYQEARRGNGNRVTDIDRVSNLVLSLMYYFYNLMPLTRGSSVVAYTVGLGIFMSMGREVTSKIPQGKLIDLEAMLSGAPDAFTLVMKQWMNIKKANTPLSSLPKVSKSFPTVRAVMEILNLGAVGC